MPSHTRKHRALATAAGLGLLAGREMVGRAREVDLQGQVALVTGGSRGLGLAMAQDLADQGARVAICARDEAELERARRNLASRGAEVVAIRCDVAVREDVERMIGEVRQALGPIDVLICNAGVIQVGQVHSMEVAYFQQAMDIMYWGVLYPILAVVPEMRERRAGRIGIVTSIGGKVSVPYMLPYSGAKFASVGLAEGLRAELADDGISVTTIVPGLMRLGSYLHAQYAGDAEGRSALYRVFAPLASLPLLTGGGEASARAFVRAVRRGNAEVVYPPQYGVLARFHGIAPATTVRMMSLANRMLPSSGGRGGIEAGIAVESRLPPPGWWRALTVLGRRAAARLNEQSPAVGDPGPGRSRRG